MKNIHVLPTDKLSRLHLWFDEKGTRLETCELEYSHTRNTQHIYITSDEKIKEGDSVISTFDRWENSGNLLPVIGKIKEIQKDDYLIEYYNSYLGEKSSMWEFGHSKKIILTTDQDLIKDGVQAIDDEFLEWFVKNPSCEFVEVDKTIPYNFDGLDSVRQDKFLELFYKSELFDEIKYNDVFDWSVNEGKDYLKLFQSYKIIIPKEEPKQKLPPLPYEYKPEDCLKETLEDAAEKWVFETNGHKWSNNDDTAGDNYGSFIAGSKWQQEQDKKMYSEEEVLNIIDSFEKLCYNYQSNKDWFPAKKSEWFEQFKKK